MFSEKKPKNITFKNSQTGKIDEPKAQNLKTNRVLSVHDFPIAWHSASDHCPYKLSKYGRWVHGLIWDGLTLCSTGSRAQILGIWELKKHLQDKSPHLPCTTTAGRDQQTPELGNFSSS